MKIKIFLIAGDPFLRAQKAKTLAATFEKEAGGPLAHQSYSLDETLLGQILSAARTLPFLAQGQVFYIQGAERLKTADFELLKTYLENPPQTTSLIFGADDLEGKSDLQKLIKDQGQIILLAKEEARSAAQAYLQQKLTRFKKMMPSSAKARLLEMCGEAVVFLDSMLDRLIQYAGERQEISEAMVAEFEEKWNEVTVFQLTNALLARDKEKAVRVFRELMEDYEADLVSIVGILHWQLRSLWHGAVLLESGDPEPVMLQKVKVPPYRQRSFMAAVRGFGAQKLEAAIEALYQLDKKSKIGQAEGVTGLESWLLQYAS